MSENTANKHWDTIIRPKTGWFDIDLKGLFHYMDLVWLLIKRNFTIMYRQTILGPLWVVIQPLMTTFIFTIVFGNIANLPTDGLPKFMFYMAGNIMWHFFSSCLTNASHTFTNNRGLFGKIYFPRLCMPLATVFTQLINFFVQFALFLGFIIYYLITKRATIEPDWRLILLTPFMLIELGILGLGFGIIISSLTTRYRDLAMLVGFGVHLWMYATPVTYSSSLIAERYPQFVGLYHLNPITPIIELFRAAFLGGNEYSFQYYGISIAITAIVLVLGVILFSHTEKTFMDTI